MPDKAVLLLISLRTKLRKQFDSSSHTNSKLWRVVSEYLSSKGYMFSPNQCKDKMDRIINDYKNFLERKKQTGQGKLKFHYEEEMERFMGDSVVVEPLFSFSAGSSHKFTKNKKATENVGDDNRKGRSRPAAKPKDKKKS